jgi:hypothetical protein
MSIGYLPWNQPAAVVDRACVLATVRSNSRNLMRSPVVTVDPDQGGR